MDAAMTTDYAAESRKMGGFTKESLERIIVSQIPSFRTSKRLIRNEEELVEAMKDDMLVKQLKGDFCWSLTFRPAFIDALCWEGFLPICIDVSGEDSLYVLLPKLHKERCCMWLKDMHIMKKVRQRSKFYELSIGKDFKGVMDACVEQHGENWLYPPMRQMFSLLYEASRPAPVDESMATSEPSESTTSASNSGSQEQQEVGSRGNSSSNTSSSSSSECGKKRHSDVAFGGNRQCQSTPVKSPQKCRFVSFELWDTRTNEMVAGELGCIVGKVYTSFTGFHKGSNTGTIQLVLTGKALENAGIDFWDIGMSMDYKINLGAKNVPRAEFLKHFRQARVKPQVIMPEGVIPNLTPLSKPKK